MAREWNYILDTAQQLVLSWATPCGPACLHHVGDPTVAHILQHPDRKNRFLRTWAKALKSLSWFMAYNANSHISSVHSAQLWGPKSTHWRCGARDCRIHKVAESKWMRGHNSCVTSPFWPLPCPKWSYSCQLPRPWHPKTMETKKASSQYRGSHRISIRRAHVFFPDLCPRSEDSLAGPRAFTSNVTVRPRTTESVRELRRKWEVFRCPGRQPHPSRMCFFYILRIWLFMHQKEGKMCLMPWRMKMNYLTTCKTNKSMNQIVVNHNNRI